MASGPRSTPPSSFDRLVPTGYLEARMSDRRTMYAVDWILSPPNMGRDPAALPTGADPALLRFRQPKGRQTILACGSRGRARPRPMQGSSHAASHRAMNAPADRSAGRAIALASAIGTDLSTAQPDASDIHPSTHRRLLP